MIVCVNQSLVFDRKNGSGWSRYLARAHRIWKKVGFSEIKINLKGRSVTLLESVQKLIMYVKFQSCSVLFFVVLL